MKQLDRIAISILSRFKLRVNSCAHGAILFFWINFQRCGEVNEQQLYFSGNHDNTQIINRWDMWRAMTTDEIWHLKISCNIFFYIYNYILTVYSYWLIIRESCCICGVNIISVNYTHRGLLIDFSNCVLRKYYILGISESTENSKPFEDWSIWWGLITSFAIT